MSTKSRTRENNNSRSILATLTSLLILRSSLPPVHGLAAIDSNRCCPTMGHGSSYGRPSDSPQSIHPSDIMYETQISTKPPKRKESPNEIQLRARTPGERQRQRNPIRENRRTFLRAAISAPFLLAAPPTKSNAFSLPNGSSSNRRQLELCLVTVLRTQYWATNVAEAVKSKLLAPPTATAAENTQTMTETQRKQPYLEARLGAKALLTQKIGGGADANVVKLSSFRIKECLDDGKYWCRRRRIDRRGGADLSSEREGGRMCPNDRLESASENLVEALASLVEFDGLETTVDPSPRSSLMLGMYTPQKGEFVYRTLTERVIPSCEAYLNAFGEKRDVALEFVRSEYSEEIPFEVLQTLYRGSDVS